MTNQNNTKVVTGVVRLSYANVWEPKSINGGAEKYSVSLIIPKSDKKTISQIETAIDNAIKEGASKFGGKIPNKAALKLPLRDGDIERDDEAYQDAMNEYMYKKEQYEKTIADINAQTSIIQQEDRTLELRLKQLDTEQNALATEMDAVKKVIDDNVEKTFKTFSD